VIVGQGERVVAVVSVAVAVVVGIGVGGNHAVLGWLGLLVAAAGEEVVALWCLRTVVGALLAGKAGVAYSC